MASEVVMRARRLLHTWPLPAVLSWLACWELFRAIQGWDLGLEWATGIACLLGVLLSLWGQTWWRRGLIAAGFPLSLGLSMLTTGATAPAWLWLVPLGLLLLVYPLNAWRDAPLFPTPPTALLELPRHAPLKDASEVLDAGCGLGDGLKALRSAYPGVRLHGLEWSWPLRFLAGLRCPWAHVRRGDIWKADWSGYDMVYLFQRPESMPRAVAKVTAELRAGAYMVSLEFEAISLKPAAHYSAPGGKMVWIYQAPFVVRTGENT